MNDFIKEFNNPTAINRPTAFWSWNDKLDNKELTRQIDEMSKQGLGGFYMHARADRVTEYLSDKWMNNIKACVRKAKEENMLAWLYDEDGWPSGQAGGFVKQHKECLSLGLVMTDKENMHTDDIEITAMTIENKDKVFVRRIFEGYVDLFNPKTTELFIKYTHEAYKNVVGDEFSKTIPGIFLDEALYCLSGFADAPMMPWSDVLEDYFYDKNGYKIREHLDKLYYDIDDYKKIRYDYHRTLLNLFMDSFTIPYSKWCEENNMKMSGHFEFEDTLLEQTQRIGAAMPHYEHMQWPAVDKLGRCITHLTTLKQVTSAAEQLGKERAVSEAFGTGGQYMSFLHRKWMADWQAILGINYVTEHLMLYSMRGNRKRDYPPNLYYQQPWWKYQKGFSDYYGRLNLIASTGKREVDILVLHTVQSVWSEYSPMHKKADFYLEKEVYHKPFLTLSERLLEEKLDYHYGDEELMSKYSKVDNDKLHMGNHSYDSIVIPPSLNLKHSTIEILKKFAETTNKESIIFIGKYPTLTDGTENNIDFSKYGTLVETVEDAITLLSKNYTDRISVTRKIDNKNAKPIFVQTRMTEFGKTILFANSDDKRDINSTIKIKSDNQKLPYIMDLGDGNIYISNAKNDNGYIYMDVHFAEGGSLLLLFTDQNLSAKPAKSCYQSGVRMTPRGKRITTISDFNVSFDDYNAMPLNYASLYVDDKLSGENEPINMLLKKFYNYPNGITFKAVYKFDIDTVPENDVFAVIELAENMSSITINGNPAAPMKTKENSLEYNENTCWKDVHFTKVPLTGNLIEGENILIVEGIKETNAYGTPIGDSKDHFACELEAVYIIGNFTVGNSNNERFWIDDVNKNVDYTNITMNGYPFYAGNSIYESSFTLECMDKNLKLELNNAEAVSVELFINDKKVGTRRWAPYCYDISDYVKQGENKIKMILSTTLYNLLGPNQTATDPTIPGYSPLSFSDWDTYQSKYVLKPFGLKDVEITK